MTGTTLVYDSHNATDQGPRLHQADAVGEHRRDDGRCAFAVADGVGNHPDAPAAARRCVETATAVAAATGEATLGVLAAREALTVMHEVEFGGDSTLVVAVPTVEGIDVAWVGDSRAYALIGDRVTQLTTDHNRGTYLRELGVEVPDGSWMFNRLTTHVRDGEIGHVRAVGPVERLLLCTDGVHGVLEPGGLIAEVMLRCRGDLPGLTRRIMAAVHDQGPIDNATVLAIEPRRSA